MAAPETGRSDPKRLEDLLDAFELSTGGEAVLRRAGLLARVRYGSTRGLLTTKALLFALGFAGSDRIRPSLQRVLIDDLTFDFSSFMQAVPEFRQTLEESFDLRILSSVDGPDEKLERTRKMGVSDNLARVLERAVSTARRLDQPAVRAEHMLLALLTEEGIRETALPEELFRHLIRQLPRTKSGPAIEMWTALLEKAAGIERGTGSTGDARRAKKPANESPSEKGATREESAAQTQLGSVIESGSASDGVDADASRAGYDEEPSPPPGLLAQVASAIDRPAAIVLQRARKWASFQRGYGAPVLTPAILLVAMIESYRADAQRQWGRSASVWGLAAERVLAEELRYQQWRGQVVEDSFEPHTTLRPGETIAAALTGPRSEELDTLLREALALRNKGFWTEDLGLDHLFAAMMSRSDVSSRLVLERLDVATEAGVAAIVRGIRQRSERRFWQSFLEEAIKTPSRVAVEPAALVAARFLSDSPDADDLLDVEEEARSFARYIGKEALDTPLAIGLFGDWGSGKSFFMNRLKRFVGELAGAGKGWCNDIVQIEFNAWHYIESNLWASLVEHILNELERWYEARNREDEIKALFEQFESAREVERESDEQLERARQAREDAEEELNQARAALAIRIKRQRRVSVDVLWNAIQRRFSSVLESNEQLKETLDDASATLGLPALRSSAREVSDVLEQAKSTAGRVRLMVGSLVARDRGGWQWAVLVALVALAPFAAGAAWSWLVEISQAPARIGAGVAELSGLLSVLVAWAGHGLATANKALQELDSVRAEMQSIVQEKTEARERVVAKAQARVATATERVEKAEARLSSARQRVDEARRALEAETPRSRLMRFLKMRLENADYTQHLGVVSMIRRDFELLSGIMTRRDWSSENERRLKEAGIDPESLRTFDRIVLYIDDLDRCPAQRVAEVLQAVHLLLAFPLFVVVVGVDARWVSQSLALHYPHLLDESAAAGRPGVNGEPGSHPRSDLLIASSHDYLEKIFQVPYWVKPMDATASARFLEGLARQSLRMREEDEPDEPEHPATRASAAHEAGAVRSEEAETVEPATVDSRSSSTVRAESVVADEAEAHSSTTASPAENPVPRPRADVPVLADLPLSEHEIAFMSKLAPSVGRSPRRAKRFFNVYQLIRAGLSAEERERFVGGRGQGLDYRVVMGLLAVVTGAPTRAPRVFDILLDVAVNNGTIVAARERWEHEHSLVQSDERWRVDSVLDLLAGIGDDRQTLERVRYWMRRAMRFSFTSCAPAVAHR